MQIVKDFENQEKVYGYSKDSQNNIWYWNFDGENLAFRDYGYPINHPFNETGEIPTKVRNTTKEFLKY